MPCNKKLNSKLTSCKSKSASANKSKCGTNCKSIKGGNILGVPKVEMELQNPLVTSTYKAPSSPILPNGSTGLNIQSNTSSQLVTKPSDLSSTITKPTNTSVLKIPSQPLPSMQSNGYIGGKKVKRVRKAIKGGDMLSDIGNLSVPFAILLAKQGLESMFHNKEKIKKKTKDIKEKIKGKLTKSKKGGNCGSTCSASISPLTGGNKEETNTLRSKQVKDRFIKLSNEIDNFLMKY